jgi:GntR family transcriptional repressor for pyruvate dehydrogenase complex
MPPELPLHGSRSEEVAAELRDEILRGQYRPGERLPSERDLSERFRTSRGAVREALKKLEQLGIASIRRGGARVVPIEHCTLDLLGPLLDLDEIPNPKLVDEVMQIFGVLLDVAARAALEKSTQAQIDKAQQIVTDMLGNTKPGAGQHEAIRRLAEFFIDVADHLVLRLMINGLRTSFMTKLPRLGIRLELDAERYREVANQLQAGLNRRDADEVGLAMKGLNRLFREAARRALDRDAVTQPRISA